MTSLFRLGTNVLKRGNTAVRRATASCLSRAGVPSRFLVRHDLLLREHYAFPLYLASVEARKLGWKEMTVVELGVGGGGGLLNLCELCRVFSRDIGLSYRIAGFDTGTGLPDPKDFRDHPEVWRAAQFTHDREQLKQSLSANAQIFYGDVAETIPRFWTDAHAQAPIGFVVLDLDYYSSSKTALDGLFKGPADRYLPAVTMYVDDIDVLLTYNEFCGEALAMKEFNSENERRKLERKPVRVTRRPKYWHRHIYCLHVLDHPARTGIGNNALGGENEINVLAL